MGTVIVNATPGNASLAGGLADDSFEPYVRNATGSQFVDVVLDADFWTPHTLLEGASCSYTSQRSSGVCHMQEEAMVRLYSPANEPYGWNEVVAPSLVSLVVSVENNRTLRLRFPPFALYDITSLPRGASKPPSPDQPPLALLCSPLR